VRGDTVKRFRCPIGLHRRDIGHAMIGRSALKSGEWATPLFNRHHAPSLRAASAKV
jgi:hypothetical protein